MRCRYSGVYPHGRSFATSLCWYRANLHWEDKITRLAGTVLACLVAPARIRLPRGIVLVAWILLYQIITLLTSWGATFSSVIALVAAPSGTARGHSVIGLRGAALSIEEPFALVATEPAQPVGIAGLDIPRHVLKHESHRPAPFVEECTVVVSNPVSINDIRRWESLSPAVPRSLPSDPPRSETAPRRRIGPRSLVETIPVRSAHKVERVPG